MTKLQVPNKKPTEFITHIRQELDNNFLPADLRQSIINLCDIAEQEHALLTITLDNGITGLLDSIDVASILKHHSGV